MEVGGIFVEPLIFLTAIGFGLGGYIENMGDLSYAEFFAPGVVAVQVVRDLDQRL